MFDSITFGDQEIKPALFLAPMAGNTHSAFRRLLSDFGGYGALFTEMLSGKGILYENMENSTFTKRRVSEGKVIYQLLLSDDENFTEIFERLKRINPFGIDLNLGCPAPNVRRVDAGSKLFTDIEKLEKVLKAVRKNWDGIFTVKVRLGEDPEDWREGFIKRLNLFNEYEIDAITVHPRFVKDRLKRRARWEEFSWIKDHCAIPLIGNGDITNKCQIDDKFNKLDGLMIGRAAVAKPWIFQSILEGIDEKVIDYAEVWQRYYNYVLEDFEHRKALGRIKEFNGYYSKNFFFGHKLYSLVQGSSDLNFIYDKAMDFLSRSPQLSKTINLSGI